MTSGAKITDLPDEVLENILKYMSFDEIAKNREVCHKFNVVCGALLNRGFVAMERRHSTILKRVKSLLPRRESERRVHQLARHSDILTAIETRISMLRMTFMKYVETNACCFIPGKVIDEILRILTLVESTANPSRTHEVLQELRDISSMAMEHFDEKIAPNLKLAVVQRSLPPYPVISSPSLFSSSLSGLVVKDTFRKDLSAIQRRSLVHKQQISILKDIVGKLVSKVKKQNNLIHSQSVKIREQSTKLKEQDTCIADLKRHVEEWDLKFADLVAELSRARDETSSSNTNNVSLPPETPSSNISVISNLSTSMPRIYKSNIKPRMAQILPRSLSRADLSSCELERKRKLPTSSMIVPNKITRLSYLTKNDKIDNDSSGDIRSILSGMDGFSCLPNFLSSSLESILKSPISSIKSRKRKLQ